MSHRHIARPFVGRAGELGTWGGVKEVLHRARVLPAAFGNETMHVYGIEITVDHI